MQLEDKINSVIGNKYDYQTANCWDLVMFLNDKAPKIDEIHSSIFSTSKKFKEYEHEHGSDYITVLFPDNGDFVLLGNGDLYTHAGIFYADGIVHASKAGVVWQPIFTIKKLFTKQKAYKCKR